MNRCFCDPGFAGPDCAIVVPITTSAPTEAVPENTIKMEKKETRYGKRIAATPNLFQIKNLKKKK